MYFATDDEAEGGRYATTLRFGLFSGPVADRRPVTIRQHCNSFRTALCNAVRNALSNSFRSTVLNALLCTYFDEPKEGRYATSFCFGFTSGPVTYLEPLVPRICNAVRNAVYQAARNAVRNTLR